MKVTFLCDKEAVRHMRRYVKRYMQSDDLGYFIKMSIGFGKTAHDAYPDDWLEKRPKQRVTFETNDPAIMAMSDSEIEAYCLGRLRVQFLGDAMRKELRIA